MIETKLEKGSMNLGLSWSRPRGCLALGARSMWIADVCWIWCVIDDQSEWCCLDIHLDCEEPPQDEDPKRTFWLSSDLESVGLGDALHCPIQLDTWLLYLGLAPGQPFLIRARQLCCKSYEGEYEVDIILSVIDRARWTDDQAAAAWEQYYGRQHLMAPMV